MKAIEFTDEEVELLIAVLENTKRGLTSEEWEKMMERMMQEKLDGKLDSFAKTSIKMFVKGILFDIDNLLAKLYMVKEKQEKA